MQANERTEGDSCVVEMSGPHEAALLIEVARACGHAAYFMPRSVTDVEVVASEFAMAGIASKLRPALRLFRFRRWEAMAEAVVAIGGEPSQALLKSLARAQERLEALSATDEVQGGRTEPSNN